MKGCEGERGLEGAVVTLAESGARQVHFCLKRNSWQARPSGRATDHTGSAISIRSRPTATRPVKCRRTPSNHMSSVIEGMSPGTK